MADKDAEVTYVTNLAVNGFNNGIVNLCFVTAHFLPTRSGDQLVVATAEAVSANLRFDLYVAQQVHEALGRILAEHTKPKVTN